MLSSPSSEATLCDGQRAPLGSRPSRPGPSTAAPTPASRPSTVTSCYPAAQRRTVALWVLSSHRREVGQTGTVGGGRRFCQEAVEVRAHDVVEHRLRRRARFVDLREHDGARQCRAAAPRYDRGTLSTGARDRASGLRLGACNPTGNVVFRGAGRGLAVVALVRVAAARPVPCRRRLHQSRPCGISRRVDGSTVPRRSASARAQPRTPAGHRDAAACRGRARSSRQHTRAPGRCESRRS
jgi:hypothetical protein